MIHWKRLVLVVAVLSGWLTACGVITSAGALIDYRRSGGFVGLEDRLTIDASGRATLTRKTGRGEFALDRAVLTELTRLLDGADFPNLQHEYLPPRKGADLIEYVLTYRSHSVRMVDTAVPESLQPALDILNRIVESGGRL